MTSPVDETLLPVERLHKALVGVCWGGFFAGTYLAGIDPFNDHDAISINLVVDWILAEQTRRAH